MFFKTSAFELQAQLDALEKSQATIQFNMDGTIITANDHFLNALGYTLDEIKGKHHSMFVDAAYRDSAEYAAFWDSLRRGEFQVAEYKRIGKGGKEVWIQASYNPIIGRDGKPFKVVKYATDVTDQKLKNADVAGQIAAIHKSQAVIEFNLDGTIITANENFLNVLGYTLDEIQGKHHSMFVEAAYRSSPEYTAFWDSLRRGEYQAAEYKRLGKGGKEIWIQASYNPILDMNGNPFKVVKFATDMTAAVQDRMRRAELQKQIDEDLAEISTAVDKATAQATSAAMASSETSQNVQAMASGSEELAASVSEISSQVANSTRISGEAVERANQTTQTVSGLVEAAQRIGDVVSLINDIADQTNLLALNATIEAARAGDAGKGFAVVASEVKNLASQTGKATEEISEQIMSVQSATNSAVEAIDSIGTIIGQVNETSAAIAAAVEEQTAVTQDMSANMQTAATGVNTISNGMSEIAEVTKFINDSTIKVKEASAALA